MRIKPFGVVSDGNASADNGEMMMNFILKFCYCLLGTLVACMQIGVAQAAEIVDGPSTSVTQRNGMHVCPVGLFVVGVHEANNELLCSDLFGSYQASQEIVDGDNEPVTVRAQMHACPQGMGMTGLHAANNWLSCAPITGGIKSEQLDGSPPTVRENMHACPPGLVVTGIHLANNQLLCGRTDGSGQSGFIDNSLLPQNALPAGWKNLETTQDRCRTQDVVLVFDRYFDIRSNQEPIGNTGNFVVVSKGAPDVVIDLADRRFRWHCGLRNNTWVGSVSDVGGQFAQGKCNEALRSSDQTLQGIYVALCQALGPVVGEIIRGFSGNWEATRCAVGTKKVKLNYATNGRLTWDCYGPPEG